MTDKATTPPVKSADVLTLDDKVDRTEFDETDADERGWIVYYGPPDVDGVRAAFRVPTQHWARYERHHNL